MKILAEIIQISAFELSLFAIVISTLLSIITYFIKLQIDNQKEFNKQNSIEHKEIKRFLDLTSKKLFQIQQNEDDIKVLTKRVDKHQEDITNIKIKINE